MAKTLRDAQNLIKAGDKAAARSIVRSHILNHPDDYRGWWLLANAASSEGEQRKAVARVLSLKPGHPGAHKMQAVLTGPTHQTDDDWEIPVIKQTSASKGRAAKRNTNNDVYLYVLVGVLALIVVCGASVFFVQRQLNTMMTTFVENVDELSAPMLLNGSLTTHGTDLIARGSLAIGESRDGTADTFDDDAWTFTGRAGQAVTIEVRARDLEFDPEVFLYSPSGLLIAENDDISLIDGNYDSRVSLTLPEDGIYTIAVSAFGLGGPYTLSTR